MLDLSKAKDRYNNAYQLGRSAALRGEAKSKYTSAYTTREERQYFDLGYYDGLKELARAQKAPQEKKDVR